MSGDLNSVAKSSKKKKGGSSKGSYSSRNFQNFVADVGALDLGFSGPKLLSQTEEWVGLTCVNNWTACAIWIGKAYFQMQGSDIL
jgi:hypothetical protein